MTRADDAGNGSAPEIGADEEVVEGLPVLADVRAIEPVAPDVRAIAPVSLAALPAVRAAAAAATGFVAGAATIALLRRRTARRVARAKTGRRLPGGLQIAGTRSFLVDVHLIAKPGD